VFVCLRNCKARKVKCGEEKPRCSNCERLDEDCDYKIRLSWGGRPLKKKLQENGGPGHDPNGDDQSQFIPGAGQFSLNQHFPSPQSFIQATPPNGAARKPPVPRAGSGKKTSMSGYQTVFAVGENMPDLPVGGGQSSAAAATPPPPPLPPSIMSRVTPITTTAPLDPQLSVQIPIGQAQQTHMADRGGVRRLSRRDDPYAWQQNLTPTTATAPESLATPFEENQMRNGQQDRSYFSPTYSTTGPFSPTHTSSPVGNYHSPPGHSSSPDVSYSQPINSPQQKNFHPAPSIVGSPTKKARTSTSPTQPPPMSPYIYGRHPISQAPQLTVSLAETIDYLNTPASMAPMSSVPESLICMPVTTGIGNRSNTVMRRVSVENLLSDPLVHGGYSGHYNGEYEFKTEGPAPYASDGQEDNDIEEIHRHDMDYEDHNFHMQVNHVRQFFKMNAAYPDQMSIPRRLDPLPQWLLSSEQNKMYFHHYLKHTARLLVPHDCSENPFKHILPQSGRPWLSTRMKPCTSLTVVFFVLVAVETDHLMNLLLAYSASHQARLLNRPEPTERIGGFIDETVRSLGVALNNPEGAASDASLATAIMLASYQIVSPNPFASSGLTWQTHLDAARKIIVSRGGAQGMHSGDTVSYFLVRWFAYLDLLGRLSGREIDEPELSDSGKYWTNDNEDPLAEFSVDCFFGFTTRCVAILHKIGALARKCEQERKMMRRGSRGIDISWQPSRDILRNALRLREELRDSRERSLGRCSHAHDNGYAHFHNGSDTGEDFDEEELLATNDAFHWAAEIHLYRRVLGYGSDHPEVQDAVGLIVDAMHKVKQGGTAENCLLFPLFTAGCEAINYEHRDYTLQRMLEVEKTGLTQV